MGIAGIMNTVLSYIILGIVAVSVFIIVYIMIYKIVLKKEIDKKYLLCLSLFFIYLVVIFGATLGSRGNYYINNIRLTLLSSYKQAWNSFSYIEWRNIILNICMFIPFGILVPFINKRCQKWWVTYGIGLLMTITIELMQWITNRGIVEVDDVFNNTLGTMIGFGFFSLGLWLYQKYKKEDTKSIFYLLCTQIPLVLTITVFAFIFISYEHQELGNLPIACYESYDMNNVQIHNEAQLSNKTQMVNVYHIERSTKEKCHKKAENIFQKLGTQINENQTNEMNDEIIYFATDYGYRLWFEYLGETYWLTSTLEERDYQQDLSLEQLQTILSQYDIEIPQGAQLSLLDNGAYEITVPFLKHGQNYIDGTVRCKIDVDNQLVELNNNLRIYHIYKQYETISSQEAFEQLEDGQFQAFALGMDMPNEIYVKKVTMTYTIDTKGFYQPVYSFQIANKDKVLETIEIPALK